jgi:hypothetical protein
MRSKNIVKHAKNKFLRLEICVTVGNSQVWQQFLPFLAPFLVLLAFFADFSSGTSLQL